MPNEHDPQGIVASQRSVEHTPLQAEEGSSSSTCFEKISEMANRRTAERASLAPMPEESSGAFDAAAWRVRLPDQDKDARAEP